MSTTTPKIGDKFVTTINGATFALIRVAPTWEGGATPFWVDGVAAVHADDFNPPTKIGKIGKIFRVTLSPLGGFETRDKRVARRFVRNIKRFGFAAATASKMMSRE